MGCAGVSPVRPPLSGLPWVRFLEFPRDRLMDSPHWLLDVRNADGSLQGSVQVPRTIGIHAKPVAIHLEPKGHLSGFVRDSAGLPVEGARIRVRPRSAAANASVADRRGTASAAEGSFQSGLQAMRALVGREELPWPQFHPASSSTPDFAMAWGVESLPVVFVIDRSGRLRSVDAGADLEELIVRLLAE